MQAAEIGRKIREIREQQKMTQTDLAAKVGIRQGDLSDLERGEHMPTIPTLHKVAQVLSVTLDAFIQENLQNSPLTL